MSNLSNLVPFHSGQIKHFYFIYKCTCPGKKLKKVNAILNFIFYINYHEVSKSAKIRNQYNQVPHLTQDTNGKVKYSQSDTTNKSQEVSPFPAGDHKAHINRRT